MAILPGATCTGQDVAQRLTSDGYVIVSGLMSERDVEAARAAWMSCSPIMPETIT